MQRGITEDEDTEEFLSFAPKQAHDPFLLMNMKAGVDLILSSVENKKKICIYGDYDADGITSTCILKIMLDSLGSDAGYYIPKRTEEGYGLNKNAVKKLRDAGTELLITVDCGSNSYEEVEYAKDIGLEVIVTDHHNVSDRRADCIMINPKQPECGYPFKSLAGCGVAFKMAQAIRDSAGLPKSLTNGLLDITAIGTVGDIVPLTGENRTLVKYGLYEINKLNRPGIKKLSETVFPGGGKLGSDRIAYGIVPHLNAAGRMKDASAGVELLLAEDDRRAGILAEELAMYNRERKRLQEKTFGECLELAEEQCKGSLFPVIKDENAHEGIAGIVAGKLKDEWHRPVIILTPSDRYLKGTGRSIEKIDIFEVLDRHSELFQRFGGHQGACGFLMPEENLDALRKYMNDEAERSLSLDPDLFREEEVFDMDIGTGDITQELAEELLLLEPFGCGNRKPVFRIKNAGITDPALMGAEGKHARFSAVSGSGRLNCVLFGKAEKYGDLIFEKKKADIYGNIEINTWNHSKKIQFIVEDMI